MDSIACQQASSAASRRTPMTPNCIRITADHFDHDAPFDFTSHAGYVPVTQHSAAEAYELVLAGAGWRRDAVTLRAVQETIDRNGTWGNHRPADWMEGLTPGTPPVDADQDGMADTWETAHGLDPNDGDDHSTVMPSGYTAIEEYINELADALVGGVLFGDSFESQDTSAWSSVR
jgi:pectate lyase